MKLANLLVLAVVGCVLCAAGVVLVSGEEDAPPGATPQPGPEGVGQLADVLRRLEALEQHPSSATGNTEAELNALLTTEMGGSGGELPSTQELDQLLRAYQELPGDAAELDLDALLGGLEGSER